MGEPQAPAWWPPEVPYKPGPKSPNGQPTTEPREYSGIWVPASQIPMLRVRWLMDTPIMKIPMGELTICAGREGAAKSMFTIWLAAQITRGTLGGELYGRPRRVIIVAREDSWMHTIVPRLWVAGADMTMVGYIVAHQAWSERDLELSLPDHLDALEEQIGVLDAALVIFDPLMSVLGSINTNHAGEVRQRIEPLAHLAQGSGVSMVALAHFAKTEGRDAASLISGSHAFKDVARAIIAFARDEDTSGICSQVKNNLGKLPTISGTYTMLSRMIEIEGAYSEVPYFWPGDQTRRHVEDLLDQGQARAVARARDFLRGLFTGLAPGTLLVSKEVSDEARQNGISEKTLQRAKEAIGVEPVRGTGTDHRWYLRLPA
jgi:hypothetical protein